LAADFYGIFFSLFWKFNQSSWRDVECEKRCTEVRRQRVAALSARSITAVERIKDLEL
jgi:hypothetical protein